MADPEVLVGEFVAPGKVVLLAGRPGSGKSTLAGQMAGVFTDRGCRVVGLCADPGSPAWGPPGAVNFAERIGAAWNVIDSEGIGSLNAGRFRLPLVTAVRKLLRRVDTAGAAVLVDAPGLHRGLVAAEALEALVDAVGADTILMLHDPGDEPEIFNALSATSAHIISVASHPEASSPTKPARARARTAAWDDYLKGAEALRIPASVPRLGFSPPPELSDAWRGRQVVLLDADGQTLALGEVDTASRAGLEVRAPLEDANEVAHLLIRDARRNERGQLRTDTKKGSGQSLRVKPHFSGRKRGIVEIEPGGAMSTRIGFADFTLLGGVFGDPTVHVRVQHQRRRILFDLGSAGRLPPKVLHRVSDVFVTHAHFDHFAGFVDLLRRWVHSDAVCRVWGPPGLADQVEAMTRAFTWDRIGKGEGPVFVVGEFDGTRLRVTRIEAAVRGGRVEVSEESVEDGLLLREPRFRVRACTLEHGTTVLA
ncbi:MAG: Clp1/GlmU family protein, partial [Persicimonas sp.]